MRKVIPLFVLLFVLAVGTRAFALDPVAPKSERGSGFLKVQTPLPESDTAELTGAKNFKQEIKPGEMVKVPVGNYTLKVNLQGDQKWSSSVEIKPTEYTKATVTGYGNLKVNTPNPESDQIEVTSQDGKVVKEFHSKKIKTLPIGTYSVKIKVGKASTVENDVVIVTNTTRELDVTEATAGGK